MVCITFVLPFANEIDDSLLYRVDLLDPTNLTLLYTVFVSYVLNLLDCWDFLSLTPPQKKTRLGLYLVEILFRVVEEPRICLPSSAGNSIKLGSRFTRTSRVATQDKVTSLARVKDHLLNSQFGPRRLYFWFKEKKGGKQLERVASRNSVDHVNHCHTENYWICDLYFHLDIYTAYRDSNKTTNQNTPKN